MDYITVYQGSTKSVNVNLTNPDETPYNASGASLYLTVGRNYTDTTPLFSLATTGLGSNLTDALTGLMTFSLGTGETTLCAGTYPGSLLLIDVLSGRSPAAVGYIVTPIPLPPS